ncbi:hypothetical protein LCGC14_2105730 [marine sediment metagenome]|uniref:Uncharacterized protein n=1 Tax=marine sediment metagenome TaxID=412755 RepID=A0A0F9E8U0_9ZZZZ
MKRKATPKQLRALAKGRKKRKANLRKLKKTKRKRVSRPRKPKKRRRTNLTLRTNLSSLMALTGGTGDINGQYYTGTITLSLTDATTTQAYLAPVSKGIFTKAGKATVMEILRIYAHMPSFPFLGNVAETSKSRSLIFSSTDGLKTGINDASTFAGFTSTLHGAWTAGGSYGLHFDGIYMWDCTDDAGHGFLLASDYFYVSADTNGWTPAIGTFAFKLLYRYKNVSLTEYIGIVQSQQ